MPRTARCRLILHLPKCKPFSHPSATLTPSPQLIADSPAPTAAQTLYSQMMRDIEGGGGGSDVLEQVRLARVSGGAASGCGKPRRA